ncbi:MAG: glutamate synthase subunit beta, partial [Atopobiaceae bacterium]
AVARRLADDFDAVVVTAGAGDARRLTVPGADAKGVCLAVDYLTASTKSVVGGGEPAISAKGLDVVVVGGGDTGTDCVATALRQGAKSVSQLEFLPAPPEARVPGNPWPEWPNVKKTDYGQVEAASVQGTDPRTWATDTLEVLGEGGAVSGLRVASLDWSHGKPERIAGSEREIPAQLVLLAMGFTGPSRGVFDALGVELSEARGGVRPVMEKADGHKAKGAERVYAAGDARNGSSLVVSALADGLAAATEVAADLGL